MPAHALASTGFVLALAACSSPGSGGGQASGSAAAAASQPAPTASAASQPPVDVQGVCGKLCKRAAACGFEFAEAIAKVGGAPDKPALERAKSDIAAVEKDCSTTCAKNPPGPTDAASAKRAEACLAETACDAFQACLSKVGETM